MLDIALKEWAVVCDLLVEGRLVILLRKGGIHEEGGPGRFKLENQCFALFPAWEHQDPRKLKKPYCDEAEEFESEPSEVVLRGVGEVNHIWQVPSRGAFDALEDLHCWTGDQIDMRFAYKPERPLYLLAVRAYRFKEPKCIVNQPGYAGCRSWVSLEAGDAVETHDAIPAMDDAGFGEVVGRIERAFA